MSAASADICGERHHQGNASHRFETTHRVSDSFGRDVSDRSAPKGGYVADKEALSDHVLACCWTKTWNEQTRDWHGVADSQREEPGKEGNFMCIGRVK